MKYEEVKYQILKKLNEGLPEYLTYHCPEHTSDVLQAATDIAIKEKISGSDLTLLKTAAVFHDTGFLDRYKDHEEESCAFARRMLPEFDYLPSQIDHICKLIMATKIPQSPKDKLAEILCDADLDYLGRDDYWAIAESLFKEFRKIGIVKKEEDWNRLQLNFFMGHHYFTETSRKLREPVKQKHLEAVRKIVDGYEQK